MDTNVFISAFFWKGNPNAILKKCCLGELQLLTSEDILEEVEYILAREKKFELTHEEIADYVKLIRKSSELIHPTVRINKIREDPSDDKFLECAISGKADYVISGDDHLLNLRKYQSVKIVNCAEFLRIIGE